MANLTKEQRLAKEAEEKAKMQAEIEAKIRAEYEEKLKAAKEELKSNATEIQNTAKIPLDTVVPVVCNVIGGAIYKSAKTIGYTIDWDAYGSVEYVELSELVSMRNTARRFFEDNWIVLEDTEEFTSVQLYDFLRVTKYYENAFTPETIDTIFDMNDKEIIRVVSELSKGMKDTIATRAKEKIDAKELDSNKKIEALETALNVKFSI